MNRSEQDRLADEIFQTDELEDLRRASLEQGLTCLRGRIRQRRALRLSALGGAAVILTLVVLVWEQTASWLGRNHDARSVVSVRPATPVGDGPIRFISDEELLSLFTNRPVALIGKPGQQELVFLDTLVAAHQADEKHLAGEISN